MPRPMASRLDELLHELDMLVFRLEREPNPDRDALLAERQRLRRDLEHLRDQVADLVRDA